MVHFGLLNQNGECKSKKYENIGKVVNQILDYNHSFVDFIDNELYLDQMRLHLFLEDTEKINKAYKELMVLLKEELRLRSENFIQNNSLVLGHINKFSKFFEYFQHLRLFLLNLTDEKYCLNTKELERKKSEIADIVLLKNQYFMELCELF